MTQSAYYNIYEEYGFKHFQLPKVFFTNPMYIKLSNDAKIAWSILKDRHELSIKNGWYDNENRIFFIYSNTTLMEILGLSKNTVTKVKKELKDVNLITIKKQGQGKPDMLYLLKPELKDEDIYLIQKHENETENPNGKNESHKKWDSAQSVGGVKKHKYWDSKITNNGMPESQNLPPNDTDLSDTEINDTENKNLYLDQMSKYIWEMKLPMPLKKFFSDKVKVLFTDTTFDITEIEYFYNAYTDYIQPDCTREDEMYLNDIEFTKTMKKMFSEVSRPINNMEGLIKTWVQAAIHYKMENNND